MTEEFNYTNSLNLAVALIIITLGVFGIVCNASIVYIYLKENSEKTAFNLICFFRGVSNCIILTNVFIITFFPKTLLGESPFPPVIESYLINSANTLYLGNEYQIVLVALNRFCALFFPMKYSKIFSVLNTTIVLVVIYLYRIGKKIFDIYRDPGCLAIYSTQALAWSYTECTWEDDALDVILYTFITMSILNTITFVKILHFYGKRSTGQDNETKKRMRKNTIHFLQTMLQDSLYLIDMSFTFKFRQSVESASCMDLYKWNFYLGMFTFNRRFHNGHVQRKIVVFQEEARKLFRHSNRGRSSETTTRNYFSINNSFCKTMTFRLNLE